MAAVPAPVSLLFSALRPSPCSSSCSSGTVVLDCHPVFTTLIILAGWLVKTAVAGLVGGWVTVDDKAAGEMWLAYSIP